MTAVSNLNETYKIVQWNNVQDAIADLAKLTPNGQSILEAAHRYFSAAAARHIDQRLRRKYSKLEKLVIDKTNEREQLEKSLYELAGIVESVLPDFDIVKYMNDPSHLDQLMARGPLQTPCKLPPYEPGRIAPRECTASPGYFSFTPDLRQRIQANTAEDQTFEASFEVPNNNQNFSGPQATSTPRGPGFIRPDGFNNISAIQPVMTQSQQSMCQPCGESPRSRIQLDETGNQAVAVQAVTGNIPQQVKLTFYDDSAMLETETGQRFVFQKN